MTTRRRTRATLVALAAAMLGVVAPLAAPAQAVSGAWNDGRSDHDTITDCITGTSGTGLDAQAGWLSPTGRVPQVGEVFWIRTYVGLISLPCTKNGASFVPEVLIPAGLEYADDDAHLVEWALGYAGKPQQWRTDGLTYNRGVNGGLLIGAEGEEPFYLRQSQVLEIHIPVRATRELKGPATPQPECQSRREGTGPCPVAQSGDHLQVAYTLGGYGSDRRYVTPYVGLFASAPATPAPPAPPAPPASGGGGAGSGSGSGSGAGAGAGSGSGSGGSGAPHGRATSHTTAKAASRAVRVRVSSSVRPTGRVLVLERGHAVAKATLKAHGRVVVPLTRLARGRHRLVVRYVGSASVAPSTSRPVTLIVR